MKGLAVFNIRPLAALAATLLSLGLAGCQKEVAELPAPGICKNEAAEALAGKDRLSDEEAMKLTGATIVRQIKPGDPVTMDFRQERVTIETDATTNKITRAMCG